MIHVDDAYQDATEDTPEEAAAVMKGGSEDLADIFGELGLPRADSKAALLASSRAALEEAKRQLGLLAAGPAHATANLGIDYTLGKSLSCRNGAKARRRRWRKAFVKWARAQRLAD